jgi:hypothetical protein
VLRARRDDRGLLWGQEVAPPGSLDLSRAARGVDKLVEVMGVPSADKIRAIVRIGPGTDVAAAAYVN